MDFAGYADLAIGLANVEPYEAPGHDDLVSFVRDRWSWLPDSVEFTDQDHAALTQLHHDLRAVMTADDDATAADRLNDLLRRHPVSPEISGHPHGDEDPGLHLHLHRGDGSVSEHVAAVCAMGLTIELLDTGFERRGSCGHSTCEDVFIDASPGCTRRYCSQRCQNRANVAAYRARKREADEA